MVRRTIMVGSLVALSLVVAGAVVVSAAGFGGGGRVFVGDVVIGRGELLGRGELPEGVGFVVRNQLPGRGELLVRDRVQGRDGFLGAVRSRQIGLGTRLGWLRDYLDLSREQQQELLKVRQEYIAQTQELEFELQRKLLEFEELWEAEEPDETAIAQLAGEIAVIRVRLREACQAQVEKEKQLLTPEQLEKLEALSDNQIDQIGQGEGLGARVRSMIDSLIGRDGAEPRAVPDLRGFGRGLRRWLGGDSTGNSVTCPLHPMRAR